MSWEAPGTSSGSASGRRSVEHTFTFRARPMPHWDGVVHGEVMEVEPQRRLRDAWRGGSLEPW